MRKIAFITKKKIKKTKEYTILEKNARFTKVYKDLDAFMDHEFKIRFNIILIDLDELNNKDLGFINTMKKICCSAVIFGYSKKMAYGVEMLELGFDDFFSMPSQREEMLIKGNRILDSLKVSQDLLFCNELELVMEIKHREVTVKGEKIKVGKKLFKILYCLLSRKNKVIAYEEMLACIHEYYAEDSAKIALCDKERSNLRVSIKNLKALLHKDCIETIHGFGYKWTY
jgi:DNA-binding response OmpR family regulator